MRDDASLGTVKSRNSRNSRNSRVASGPQRDGGRLADLETQPLGRVGLETLEEVVDEALVTERTPRQIDRA